MEGWPKHPLSQFVTHKSGDSKIIKGKQSPEPRPDLVQGFSASGPDVWVKDAAYECPGIVISAVGARCGKTFLATGSWTPIANTHALIPGPEIDVRWLWYLTNDEAFWVKGGTAQPFVKVKPTLQRPIAIPPLPEQERIVAILDEAFAAIATATANAEKNLANARELFESVFDRLLSGAEGEWPHKQLGDCCDVKTGKKDVNEGNPDGAFPFFTCAKEHTYSDVYSFDTEAILIAGNGAVGQTSYYKGKFEAYQRTYVLSGFHGVDVRFLHHVLETKLAAEVSKSKLGNTMPYIKMGMLTGFEYPSPPLADQHDLVVALDRAKGNCKAVASNATQKLAHLDNLKQSLLHKAFTGELTADSKAADRSLSEVI